jgi:phospholipid-binding lipoprotein MlaA
MRISTWILVVWLGMVVPCFGQGIEAFSSFDLSSNALRDDFSSISQQNRGVSEWGSGKQTESLWLAQTEGEDEDDVDDEDDYDLDDIDEDEEDQDEIADPIEPLNRAFFHFNDKLYFWLFKPTASGYRYVIPKSVRFGIYNFFSNIAMPIRAVNCGLQGKFRGFGIELLRFTINTTAGIIGFRDAAKKYTGLRRQDEDFGQTLGFWGIGPGFYINWPILGPSSVRGTVGLVGDWYVHPVRWYVESPWTTFGIIAVDKVNQTSLVLGVYESIKDNAFDPYLAFRDAYVQYREKKIQE